MNKTDKPDHSLRITQLKSWLWQLWIDGQLHDVLDTQAEAYRVATDWIIKTDGEEAGEAEKSSTH